MPPTPAEAPRGPQRPTPPTVSRPSSAVQRRSPHDPPEHPYRPWWLLGGGLALLLLSHPRLWVPHSDRLFFAPLGIGLALIAWLGARAAAPVAVVLLLVNLGTHDPDAAPALVWLEPLLSVGTLALAWWCYRRRGLGARQLDDPRSATVFLILIPGVFLGLLCLTLALLRLAVRGTVDLAALRTLTAELWLNRALGVLALAPPLLVAATPWLVRYGLTRGGRGERKGQSERMLRWRWDEGIEVGGLALGAGVLGLVLAVLHAQEPADTIWALWGMLLLLIVWASLRQGLRGGTLAAAAAAATALTLAPVLNHSDGSLTPLAGNLLAQCCTALLIGASAGWVRASESRYRQVVGHIPVVLYSARLLYPCPLAIRPEDVEITLVSAASRTILGAAQEELLGDYRVWLAHIQAEDRELVAAAMGQLFLQKQPVTCEYRLALPALKSPPPPPSLLPAQQPVRSKERWVRDTLAPHHDTDGLLDGWDGVVEDITEARALAYDLRRTTNVLHAVVAHLPTGVFVIHGPTGQPMLVNTRARQLLGQREDQAAGLAHFPEVYRLYRADGAPYPWEELPICKALREGITSMSDDIVVHRPDGRQVPLINWAAPVDLSGTGRFDGAVWVLEDLTALRQAEAAHREAEARLRAIIETMAEGLIVQNHGGTIVECNPAACNILGAAEEQLYGRPALAPAEGCLRSDGSPFPRDEQPDLVSLRSRQPVRDVVMGIPLRGTAAKAQSGTADNGQPPAVRWILVNTMPLPGMLAGGAVVGPRVVTTFADITAHRHASEVLRQSEEKYRGLVETLPLMVLQFDRACHILYVNPATRALTGYSAEELAGPEAWRRLIAPDDWPALQALHQQALAGGTPTGEFRLQAKDGAEKVGLALAQPLDRDGVTAGSTLLIVDRTQQRRLESDLQKVQRLELVGRLAGGVVHDLNNLLTVILTAADSTRHKLTDGHGACEDLHYLVQAGEQAAQLTGQLMTFSKQRRFSARQVHLNAVVQRTLELLRPSLPANIIVEPTLQGDVLVQADESQLHQVVLNLCLNARDAMPKGGRLTVRTSLERAADEARSWGRLVVEDTGIGMDEAVQARIFDPFFSTKEHGHGLGLAVVQQIVQSFGGRIEVRSQPGEGTRFEIWLTTS